MLDRRDDEVVALALVGREQPPQRPVIRLRPAGGKVNFFRLRVNQRRNLLPRLLQSLFGYDATAQIGEDWMYERLAEAYALDPAIQEFFRRSNPWALKDIAERLIEAADRGLWSDAGPLRDALARVCLEAEGDIEGRAPGGTGAAPARGGHA